MKRKVIRFFLIVTVALFAGLNFLQLKDRDNVEFSNLVLENIEASAFGEGETSSGSCMTVISTELTYQDCDGHRSVSRYRVKYACQGQSGDCSSGSMYYFYDCKGEEIGTNDYVSNSSCS